MLGDVIEAVAALPPGTTVVSGGARGVDRTAWETATKSMHLRTEVISPDYAKHGPKLAPLIRNREIAERCDRMIAFWNPPSGGTANAIAWAVALGKPVEVHLAPDGSGE